MTPQAELIQWAQLIVTMFLGVLGSGGLWAYIQGRNRNSKAERALLLGLAHDRIVTRGMSFIERGWITVDEYDDFNKYLWEPYSQFGGNGLAERVRNQVAELEIRNSRHLQSVNLESKGMYTQ